MDIDVITKRMIEFRADENESPMRRDLQMRLAVWDHTPSKFLLDHGRDYMIGPDSYALPRGEIKQCFMNAAHLAIDNPDMTYVEGKVACYGLGIDHAWCVDADGVVHDPTITGHEDGHISDYYGVPFKTAYLRKALIWNGYYGLLDYWTAGKTAPQLYELGSEAGQQWLLDQPARPPRKPRKAKKAAK